MKLLVYGTLFVTSLTLSQGVLAWGEHGHDLVTRVAARQVADQNDLVAAPFSSREHMLAHLSNIPDIHRRASYMSESDRKANGPTHFIDLDLVYPNPGDLDSIVLSYDEFATAARAKDLDLDTQVGTAPWRVLQLQRRVTAALKKAASAPTKEAKVTAIDEALLYAGLMSHFVGDLANPHHTTGDYDGRQTGQGGLHAYFETLIVNSQELDLASLVMEYVRKNDLGDTLLVSYPEDRKAEILADPLQLAFALTLNSLSNLDRLRELDHENSLLEPGNEANPRATRKDPTEVADAYQDLVVERLGMGASVLSHLWLLSWQQAGQPDLSDYQSYHYWIAPDFVTPDYQK